MKKAYLRLLAENRHFRSLWLADVVSNCGDWFNLVASASLVSRLTGSSASVGVMFVLRMLAPFIVSPLAGVAADRLDRRKLMVASDFLRALIVASFLLIRQADQVWILYGLIALQMALSGLFVPARNAIIPDLVSSQQLSAANALTSATFAVMLALGAAAGGVAVGLWGIYTTLLVDAVSFLISGWLILRIRYAPHPLQSRERPSGTVLALYLDGFRYLARDLESLFLSLHKGLNSLFITGGLNLLMVVLAKERFPLGHDAGAGIGLAFCATGIGTAVGPIVARHFSADRQAAMTRGLVLCYVLSALGMALLAEPLGLFVALAGLALRGIGGGMMYVLSTQLLMLRVPNEFRGRVFSTEFGLRTLLSAAGTGLTSLMLISHLGLAGTIWLTALLALVPGLIWAGWLSSAARRKCPSRSPVGTSE
jgi:NRE family putative nickel resistance protein-like MFS transporter